MVYHIEVNSEARNLKLEFVRSHTHIFPIGEAVFLCVVVVGCVFCAKGYRIMYCSENAPLLDIIEDIF